VREPRRARRKAWCAHRVLTALAQLTALPDGVEGGGEATVCEARLIDGLSDAQTRALFDEARDGDYEAVAKEARALSAKVESATTQEESAEAGAQIRRLRKRLMEVVGLDFPRSLWAALGRELDRGTRRRVRHRRKVTCRTDCSFVS
jgi:hypothetical protein